MKTLQDHIAALPFPDAFYERLGWLRAYVATADLWQPPADRKKAKSDAAALRRVVRLVDDDPATAAALRQRLEDIDISLSIKDETQVTRKSERDAVVSHICAAIAAGYGIDVYHLGAGVKPDGSARGQLTGDSAFVARVIEELQIFEEAEDTMRKRVVLAIKEDGPLFQRMSSGQILLTVGGQLDEK